MESTEGAEVKIINSKAYVGQRICVNEGTDEEFCVTGFRRSICKFVVFHFLGILSVGLLYLIGYWNPVKRLKWIHEECPMANATSVLVKSTHEDQSFVEEVKIVELDDSSKGYLEKDFSSFELIQISEARVKYFEHRFLRYYFNHQHDEICEFSGLDNKLTVKEIYEKSHGTSVSSLNVKLLLHGENFINVPVKSYAIIFLQLIADPFYVFQLFSISLWYSDYYYYYASIVVLMTAVSLGLNTYETKNHLQKLHNMVAKATDIEILEKTSDGVKVTSKSSRDLVPGDVIVIPAEGMHLPCDAVLLNGRCIVNESSLTGESFPTTKTSIDSTSTEENMVSEFYSVSSHKRHTLYNGTEILQAHFYGGGETRILAVVIRTGFCTLKGRLIRSIIHPKPVHFTFFRDSMKFISFIGVLAVIGFVYSITVFIKQGETNSVIARKGLDIFTIAVPPELPACMSVGLMYALHRLKMRQIYCVDPARVNLCGKVKMFVFDKTGTLTEDSLEVAGVVKIEENNAQSIERDASRLVGSDIVKGMACCHSLTIIKDHITGDPLDTYMFDFTKWSLHEPTDSEGSKFEILAPVIVSPPKPQNAVFDAVQETHFDSNTKQIAIIKQYPFESSLQRMSVITKEEGDKHMTVYTKGSPEMIMSMCDKEGIPGNILETLMNFTKTGSRVLAIASKQLSTGMKWHNLKKLQRSDVECDLNILGLIIFENVLKPISKEIIETLDDANIRTIMATGDNLYTAASVAREVGIVKDYQTTISLNIDEESQLKYEILQGESLKKESKEAMSNEDARIPLPIQQYNSLNYNIALTGNTYVQLKEKFPDVLPKVLLSGRVFARMSPDQKTLLIEDLKELGYGVGMCGDGANDCGALKAAHAGIALSDTEASVASPFTSKVFDISCVPQLLKEGRAALITSFGIFKYMAMYSFVQFIGILILYSANSSYTDWQFMYADIILNLVLILTMIQSKASDTLTPQRPPGRLVHPIFISGIFLQTLLLFFFQFGSYIYVQQMSWYKSPSEFKENENEELNYICYENSSVIIISFFQYIWMSLICGRGKPFKEPIYRNYKYVAAFTATTICSLGLALYPPTDVAKFMKMTTFPNVYFPLSLVLLAFGNLYLSYLVENIFLPSRLAKRISDRIEGKTEPKNPYKHIYNSLKSDQNWPPC